MSTFSAAVPLVGRIVVPHPSFERAKRVLKRHLELARLEKAPHLVLLSGDYGVGKSFLLKVLINEVFGSESKPFRRRDGLIVKAAVAQMPPKPRPNSLLEEMLAPYAVDDIARTTEGQLKRRVTRLVNECETEIFAIEEVQHLTDRSTEKTRHHVDDIFKTIHDKIRCLMVLSGISPDLESVIAGNKQLASRVRARVNLPRFDWGKKVHREDFVYCLRHFQTQIEAAGQKMPNLIDPNWDFRLYCATGGIMRLLANFLEEVLSTASEEKEPGLKDFENAYEEFRFRPELRGFELLPFAENFLQLPRRKTLDTVNLIGMNQEGQQCKGPDRKQGTGSSRSRNSERK